MPTPSAGQTGFTLASLEQAVPAIADVADMLAAFKTLGTVPAAVAGSGCPATAAAISALGAEIVGVIVELVEKLETDAKNVVANIERYADNEAATVLGLNTVAGGLGGAATAATSTTGAVAAPLTVSPAAAPVSVVPPAVNTGVSAPAPVTSVAASSLTVGAQTATLGSAVTTDPLLKLVEDVLTGPSVLRDLSQLPPVAVGAPATARSQS